MIQLPNMPFAAVTAGPALADIPDVSTWRAASDEFCANLSVRQHRRLMDWWFERIDIEVAVPAYDSRWHKELVDIAPVLYSRERLPGTIQFRHRYVGEIPTERFGREVSGRPAAETTVYSEDDIWAFNRLILEERRPMLVSLDYRVIGRGHVKGIMLELPLRAPESGDIRFILGAAHYLDPE